MFMEYLENVFRSFMKGLENLEVCVKKRINKNNKKMQNSAVPTKEGALYWTASVGPLDLRSELRKTL